MGMQTGTLEKERLPPWAKVVVGSCLLLMVGIALWPPYEALGPDFARVSTVRQGIFQRPEPGTGLLRLRFKRLLVEEAVAVACAAVVLYLARRRSGAAVSGPREP